MSDHCPIFSGPKWQNQSNDEKLSILDPLMFNNPTPGKFHTLKMGEILIEDLNLTFDTVSDELPEQGFPLGRRSKVIHSVGVMARTVWRVVENNLGYTGIFASGCKDMYVRLSLADGPTKGPRGFIPALAMKFLRTNVPSANMFAMYTLEGQDSWNYFAHDLSNHLPDISPNAGFLLNHVRSSFAKASKYPSMIGLSNMASFDQDGNNTPAPVFPFKLVFHPTTALHNAFPDTPSDDWTGVLIQGLQTPQDLYYIYAVQNPNDDPSTFVHIGTLTSITPGTTSNFGDHHMFFEHTRMEKDFVYKPEWQSPADAIVAHTRSIEYFTFPDLPFN